MKKILSVLTCFLLVFTLEGCGGVSNEPEAVANYTMKCYVQGNYNKMKKYSVENIDGQIDRMAKNLKDALKGGKYTLKGSEDFGSKEKIYSYEVALKNGGIYGDNMRLRIFVVNKDGKWLYSSWGVY